MLKKIASRSAKEWEKTLYSLLIYSTLFAEYLLRESGLEKDESGYKIGGKYINNLHHAAGTVLLAENSNDLEALVMKVKEHREEMKRRLKKIKLMAMGIAISFRIDDDDIEMVGHFCLLRIANQQQ